MTLIGEKTISAPATGEVMSSGDVDKTLSYLKRIAPALPDDLEIQLRFAICQEMKGESEKAEQTLKTLSGRYPESSLPYLHLGELHTRHKKIDMAIANYRQAAARKPENPDVLNNLASLLLDNRKDDSAAAEEAFRLATRAWEMAPENPASADTLGWANCRKGSYDQAMMLLSFAQRRVPSSPEVRYHLAYALRGKGRLDEARSQLEAALAISSTFAGADAARAMLEELKK